MLFDQLTFKCKDKDRFATVTSDIIQINPIFFLSTYAYEEKKTQRIQILSTRTTPAFNAQWEYIAQ